MVMKKNCWNCEHRYITEHGHEWIECYCQKDKQWRDPDFCRDCFELDKKLKDQFDDNEAEQ